MQSFAELLIKYTQRTGITDSELARSVGVRRQTIFRWKEGIVARPRHRDDVLGCAKRLRLTPAELDELLVAAGFRPENALPMADATPETPEAEQHAEKLQEPIAVEASSAPVLPENALQLSSIVAESTVPKPGVENAMTAPSLADFTSADLGVQEAEVEDAARRPPTRWIASGGLLLLAILAVAGSRSGLGAMGPWFNSPTTTATVAPVVQQLPTATAGPTTSPTATQAAPAIVANEGETILLVAQFSNYTGNAGYNVAGRIQSALQNEIDAANLGIDTKSLIWGEEVRAPQRAATIVEQSQAAMLIWGEYDSGRVVVNFVVRGDLENLDIEKRLQSPDALSPAINADIPKEVQSLALFTLGRLYLGEEKSASASSALERALRAQPPPQLRSEIHFQLGRAYGSGSSVSEIGKSITQYTKALEIRPLYVWARYNRGNAYLARYRLSGPSTDESITQTDLDLAIEDYSSTLNISPSYVDALINRGNAYYQRNLASDIDAAIADFDKAIALQPEKNLPYYNRGLARIRQGLTTEWQADFEKVIELDSTYLGAFTALCWGHTLAQQPEVALERCQEALDMNPSVGSSYDGMGLAYAQLGQATEAIAAFKKYLAWLQEQASADFERYNGPLVEEWINALEAGEQPITKAVLESLR